MIGESEQGTSPGDDTNPPQRRRTAVSIIVKFLAVVAIIGILLALLLPSVRSAREPARRNQCMNNLKQIALALENYAQDHGALPPAYTTDANGKPLHSWRTLILPYLEEQRLYGSIDLTKPWDDPANAEACQTRLDVYRCPSAPWEIDNRTTYLAVVTPNSCFRSTEPRTLSDVTDGASKTLMVIEVDEGHATPWMSPVDADEAAVLGLGGLKSRTAHPGGVNAAFVDCHVSFLRDDMPADQRLALISIADGDEISDKTAD